LVDSFIFIMVINGTTGLNEVNYLCACQKDCCQFT